MGNLPASQLTTSLALGSTIGVQAAASDHDGREWQTIPRKANNPTGHFSPRVNDCIVGGFVDADEWRGPPRRHNVRLASKRQAAEAERSDLVKDAAQHQRQQLGRILRCSDDGYAKIPGVSSKSQRMIVSLP